MSNSLSWIQVGTDINGQSINEHNGRAISLNSDGKILAIASYGNGNGDNSGTVRIYKFFNSRWSGYWSQIGQNIIGESAYDYSGTSVSLNSDGNIVAIGAYSNDGNGFNSGHVRVYKYIDNLWVKIGQDIDGEAPDDQSGISISLSSDGNIVAVGAYNNDGNGSNSGHVRVYKFLDNSWSQLGQDIDGQYANDKSGVSVSLSLDGNILAIGSYNNNSNGINSGQVRIYNFIDNSWNQIGQDINGEASNDYSGYSVSLNSNGTIVAIGAYANDGNGFNSGQVRVYKFLDNSWNKLGEDIDGEASNDYSGISVSINSNGDILAVGAYYNDGNGSNSGHVRVYKFLDNSWNKIADDIDGEAINDYSGRSVSLSSDGNTVAIGGYHNDENGSNSGHTRIFKIFDYSYLPISNICFPSETPIKTDQGIINIDKINCNIHTIRGNSIKTITKTITQDKYLVCIEKDALAKNIPSQKTLISKNHKIFYSGKMITALNLLTQINDNKIIYKVKYDGSPLYNVLLKKHDKMIVNNLICETLDPLNGIARMYNDMNNLDFTISEKNDFIKKYNEYIIKNKTFISKNK
jgi:hypothetical protein